MSVSEFSFKLLDGEVVLYKHNKAATANWYVRLNSVYWKEWFSKNIKDFYLVQDADILRFSKYRVHYWKSAINASKRKFQYVKETPSTTTLSKELAMLNFFLRRAYEYRLTAIRVRTPRIAKLRDLLKKRELPLHMRRARFSDSDWTKFIKYLVARKNHNQSTDRSVFKKGEGSSRSRFLSSRNYNYILLIGNSGIRPQAARALQWRDILDPLEDQGISYTRIHIPASKCKTGIDRVIVTRDFLDSYNRLVAYQSEWAQFFERDPTPEDYLFVAAKKSLDATANLKPCDMAVPIKFALQACNLWETTTDGVLHRRTAYSARAYFITKALERGCSIDILAQHAATSPAMISTYYDQTSPVTFKSFISAHAAHYSFTKDIGDVELLKI